MDFLQVVLNGQNIGIGLTGIALFSGIGFAIQKNINNRFAKKADKAATEREFDLMNQKINRKADQSVVTRMAEQVDTIYNLLIKK